GVACERSSLEWFTVIGIHPGMRATSCARWAIEKDFSCGFQVLFSLRPRSRTRRVVAISWSNSAIIDWPIDIGSSSIGVVGGLRHGVPKLAPSHNAAP